MTHFGTAGSAKHLWDHLKSPGLLPRVTETTSRASQWWIASFPQGFLLDCSTGLRRDIQVLYRSDVRIGVVCGSLCDRIATARSPQRGVFCLKMHDSSGYMSEGKELTHCNGWNKSERGGGERSAKAIVDEPTMRRHRTGPTISQPYEGLQHRACRRRQPSSVFVAVRRPTFECTIHQLAGPGLHQRTPDRVVRKSGQQISLQGLQNL